MKSCMRRMVFISSPCVLSFKNRNLSATLLTESYAEVSGGVVAIIDKQVALKRQGVIGAVKCLH